MRSLAQPAAAIRAAYGAIITSLACYPRLAIWTDRPYAALFLTGMILGTSFVMWAFVFAWQPEYARRPVFNFDFPRQIWVLATLYGIIGAVVLNFLMDPQLRLTTPKDYPVDWHSWIAMTLFTMTLDPLFLCFAPYAFFIRLSRKPDVSLALTVLFGIFVQYLKINSFRPWPPVLLVVELVTIHIIGGFMSVYLYVKGGVLPVCWGIFLLELRHAWDLALGR